MVDEIDVRKKTGILQKNHLQLLGVPHLTAFLYSVPPPPMIHVILITNWKYFMNLGMMAHISGLGKCPDWTYIQIIYIYIYILNITQLLGIYKGICNYYYITISRRCLFVFKVKIIPEFRGIYQKPWPCKPWYFWLVGGFNPSEQY